MDLSKLTDDQLNSVAIALTKLLQDIELGEDAGPTDVAANAAEIQAAKEVEDLRCRLTGYEFASQRTGGAGGANAQIQAKIMDLKAQLRDRGQSDKAIPLMPSGWMAESDNPCLELNCRRHEYEAMVRCGSDFQQQIACLDRIKQLEMMISRGN